MQLQRIEKVITDGVENEEAKLENILKKQTYS